MKKLRVLIIILILAGLGVWYYNYLDSKKVESKSEKVVSEIDKIINKNLKTSYPETPREVVKFYNRIMLCFYNEKCSNEQLIRLSTQARLLFDDELLKHNPYEEYFTRLCDEISDFESDNRTITSCLLEGSRDVEYYTLEGSKYASIKCVYYTKGDEGTIKSSEKYVLRKDKEGKWKVLYWKLTDDGNSEDDERK